MNRKRRGTTSRFVPWTLGLAVAACSGGTTDSLDRARAEGVLRIGYAVEAPYAFVDARGTVTGEAPEVARVVATRLGIPRLEWRQVGFDALIEELLDHRFDVVAAGLFVLPERARRVAFSHPTLRVRPALLVPAGNPLGLGSYQDLVSRGVRVAVLAGSAEESALLRLGAGDADLLRVPDARSGAFLVSSGRVDGLALSAPTVRFFASAGPFSGVVPAEPFGQSRETPSGLAAFAFRAADRRLLDAWNQELAGFLGSAEHRALAGRFGIDERELVLPPGRALP
jgi:polar amino acid transport system substrate-binding protein